MGNITDNASRPDLSTLFGFGTASLTLAFLCFMLFSQSSRRGVQAASTAATKARTAKYTFTRGQHSPSLLSTLPDSSRITNKSIEPRYSAGAALAISNMFHTAVNRHEKENAKEVGASQNQAKTLSQTLFSSSPRLQYRFSQERDLQKPASALEPTSASTLNRWRNNDERRCNVVTNVAGAGLKRTASGLAKITDGSFDEAPGGSKNRPILITESVERLPKVEQSEFFNVDDFDSDLDLDVEEPVARPCSVKYPALPSASLKKSFKIPDTRPQPQPQNTGAFAFAKRQQNQYSTSAFETQDSGYGAMPSNVDRSRQGLSSSNPAPWSSSPAEHFQPAYPAHKPTINEDVPKTTEVRQQRLDGVQPRPSKRRTLPWHGEDEIDTDINTHSLKTPASKREKNSSFPWNTTASSIKAQQRVHREEAKKSTAKTIGGTEESIIAAKIKRKKPARVFLSEEQQHVLELVTEKKKSVFFTGSAGTGKSVLLREIISTLRRKFQREPDRVAVTASTGLAACNIGGVTLHSFSGIGLGKEDVPELVRKIKKNQKAKNRWLRTKILVVDEVSMVDGELFDKLEAIARQLRNNGRPFGGIQLVITGDFFQLPPVPDNSGRGARFAFDAQTWKTSIEHTIALHHVFRQKDPVFAGMLNEMREGNLTESSVKAFQKLARPLIYADSLAATELFPTRNEVDRANQERMLRLQGDLVVYDSKDGGSVVDQNQRDKLLSNCMAPQTISLKKGAQVMLIKNIDETLVNGSLGRVIGFMDEETFATYHADEEAFAQTQSGTLVDEVRDSINAGDSESRKRQRDKLVIGTGPRYPLVRFTIADGTFRDLLCSRESWKIELPNGEVQASRSQVPLILAWALSIHKAQGQTLDRVKVDLGKVFENGQAYVALSRATSMGGLQVLRFDPKKVTAHARVRNFYANLSKIEFASKEGKSGPEMKKPAIKKEDNGGLTADEYEKNFLDDAF